MDDVATILILIGISIFILALVAFFKPMPKLWLGTRKAASAALALSVASCVAGGVIMPPTEAQPAGPTAKPEPPQKPSLKEASRNITEVSAAGKRLTVRVRIETAWDDAAFVEASGRAVGEIAKVLQSGAREDGPAIEEVGLEVHVPSTDRLGNEGELHLLGAVFSAADLRAMKTDNLTNARMLDLSTVAWPGSPAGESAIIKWCQKNVEDAPAFCAKALL